MRNSSRKLIVTLIAALVLFTQAGCLEQMRLRNDTNRVSSSSGFAIETLASLLHMNVEAVSDTSATLRSDKAQVMIFSEPVGQIYVNGKPLAQSGGVYTHYGRMEVSRATARALRSALAGISDSPVKTLPAGRSSNPPATLGSVVLDAGHGGKDTGTDAAVKNFRMNLYEKDVNLPMTLAVGKNLTKRGVKVHMTRTTDKFVSLDERVEISNRLKPDLFVSIHANMLADRSFSGFMVFVTPRASAKSVKAAQIMVRHMRDTGLVDHGMRRNDLRVVTNTHAPAVLIETACLSNRSDARFLASPAGRAKVVKAITDAVVEYLTNR